VPPDISEFGLLAPGVGWGANGIGFFITRDGGHRWTTVPVPDLSGDIVANLLASASPSPEDLILSFTGGSAAYDRACPHPVSLADPAGVVAISTDAGRTWRVSHHLHCDVFTALSFVTSHAGFALAPASADVALDGTSTGARSWHHLGTAPVSNQNADASIDFGTARDGWAIRTEQAGTGASDRGRLSETTDGGHHWRPASICQSAADATVTVTCQTPVFRGAQGAVLAVSVNRRTHRDHLLSYTTVDSGRSWITHTLPAGPILQRYVAQQQPIPFSAPSPRDLDVLLSGTLLLSSDRGRHWLQIPQPALTGSGQIDFVTRNDGWADVGGHFDSTTDGGRIWQPIGTK
jgi:photosystem II stability/assembly factor-like uncharacterized protein